MQTKQGTCQRDNNRTKSRKQLKSTNGISTQQDILPPFTILFIKARISNLISSWISKSRNSCNKKLSKQKPLKSFIYLFNLTVAIENTNIGLQKCSPKKTVNANMVPVHFQVLNFFVDLWLKKWKMVVQKKNLK